MQNLNDLELLLKSDVSVLAIESQEEDRVIMLFERANTKIQKRLYQWTITDGLIRLPRTGRDILQPLPSTSPQLQLEDDRFSPPPPSAPSYDNKPMDVLNLIKMTTYAGIYLLCDFHPYLTESVIVRHIKDIAQKHTEIPHIIVLISHELKIPEELSRLTTRFELAMPDRETLEKLIRAEAKIWSAMNSNINIAVQGPLVNRLAEGLLGLPMQDVERLVRGAIRDDGVLSESDIKEVMKTKYELLGREGVLSFEYDTARFADVGGLNKLKDWLSIRKGSFTGEARIPGLDPPKGIMLLGVQGCGKSLTAKAVAGIWGVPLLSLDFGSVYNKYYGESEKNIRNSLKSAELMSPCVLWVDEIEKGISAGDMDGGTSKRILGTFLTWMAEKNARVFIVATANDIQSLPPELMRKGRFDEIFFVDLPDKATREDIFRIHLEKRHIDANKFEMELLAKTSEGFSGAEIEQAVVSALYSVHAKNTSLNNTFLLDELKKTQPLSVVMAEQINALRAWAKDRTVKAN